MGSERSRRMRWLSEIKEEDGRGGTGRAGCTRVVYGLDGGGQARYSRQVFRERAIGVASQDRTGPGWMGISLRAIGRDRQTRHWRSANASWRLVEMAWMRRGLSSGARSGCATTTTRSYRGICVTSGRELCGVGDGVAPRCEKMRREDSPGLLCRLGVYVQEKWHELATSKEDGERRTEETKLRRKVRPRWLAGAACHGPQAEGEECRIGRQERRIVRVGATHAKTPCTCTPRSVRVSMRIRYYDLPGWGRARDVSMDELEAPPRCSCGLKCRARNTAGDGPAPQAPGLLRRRIRYPWLR